MRAASEPRRPPGPEIERDPEETREEPELELPRKRAPEVGPRPDRDEPEMPGRDPRRKEPEVEERPPPPDRRRDHRGV